MVMATALYATASAAKGQDGDVSAGHAFAREACKACHMIAAEENSPRMIVIGPAFHDIANTRGMTATAGFPHDLTPEDAQLDPHTG